jgi:hypothetical protein
LADRAGVKLVAVSDDVSVPGADYQVENSALEGGAIVAGVPEEADHGDERLLRSVVEVQHYQGAVPAKLDRVQKMKRKTVPKNGKRKRWWRTHRIFDPISSSSLVLSLLWFASSSLRLGSSSLWLVSLWISSE